MIISGYFLSAAQSVLAQQVSQSELERLTEGLNATGDSLSQEDMELIDRLIEQNRRESGGSLSDEELDNLQDVMNLRGKKKQEQKVTYQYKKKKPEPETLVPRLWNIPD